MLQKGLEFRLADANFGALGSCAQQNLAGVFVCNVQCDSTGTFVVKFVVYMAVVFSQAVRQHEIAQDLLRRNGEAEETPGHLDRPPAAPVSDPTLPVLSGVHSEARRHRADRHQADVVDVLAEELVGLMQTKEPGGIGV